MKHNIIKDIKYICIIFLSFYFSQKGNALSKTEENIVSFIAEKLDEAEANENYSGVLLLGKKDKVLFEKAYGMANKQYQILNNIDTKFNMASEGKLFTSFAIAQLIDRGLLSLSDPISKYLVHWLEDPASKTITVQDLLVHTSGLGSFFENEEFKLTASSGRYLQVDQYKPLLQKDKLRFKPGSSQLYSNNGYILLGAIIENISGETYFDYIQTHIFDPLDMKNSGFYEMDEVIPNLAIGWGRENKGAQIVWKNNLFTNVFKGSPAGGGFSTIRDMFKFVNAVLESKLLSKEMTRQFLSGQAMVPDTHLYTKDIDVQGQKFTIVFSDYGPAGVWNQFGLEIYSQSPLSLGHNGGGMRGIDNDCVIWPDKGYFLLYFSNYTGEGLYYPGPEMKQLIQKHYQQL